MKPRYKLQRDKSEKPIVQTLRQCGASVLLTDTPVDSLVGFRGKNYLVEIKTGEKGYGKSLNANQQKFSDSWRGGEIIILRDPDEAVAFVNSLRFDID